MNSIRWLACLGVLVLPALAPAAEVVLVRQILETPTRWTTQSTIDESLDKVRRRLQAVGVVSRTVDDTKLDAAALAAAKVAILPQNPTLPAPAAKELTTFVGGGGKLICFYHADAALLPLLGIESLAYRGGEQFPKVARVGFTASLLPGAPPNMAQASWNINEPRLLPGRGGAKIAGTWRDAAGRDTGIAALALHPNGAFFTHVYLDEDPAAGGQFFLALLGTFRPALWPQAVEAQLAQVGVFAGIPDLAALARAVAASGRREAEAALTLASRRQDEARRLLAANQPAEALRAAQEAVAAGQEAFLASRPSRQGELRGAWIHSAYGIPEWGWDRTARVLAENGFNALFVNLCWGAVADYRSEVLPVHPEVAVKGDQMEACLAACRKHGIALHVWRVNWNMGHRTPQDIKDKMTAAGRTQQKLDGSPSPYLAPHIEANFILERDAMLEIVRKYPVDGIHFDYIRYPGADCDFSDSARAAFAAWLGQEVVGWPQSCAAGGALRRKYNEWRRGNISRLVEAVSGEAHRLRPGIKVSAAVFGEWDSTGESIAQDTVAWLRRGWLDFVCPMNYTNSNAGLERLLRMQEPLTPAGIPLYVGLGAWQHESPARTVEQIELVRRLGGDGFICFAHNLRFAETTLPALGKGVTREPVAGLQPHESISGTFALPVAGGEMGGAFRVGDELVFTLTMPPEVATFTPEVAVLVDGYAHNMGGRLQLRERGRELRIAVRAPVAGQYRIEVSGTWAEGGRRAQAKPFLIRSRSVRVLSGDEAETILARERPPVFRNTGGLRVAVWQDNAYGAAPILAHLEQVEGIDAAPLWNLRRESLAACQVVVLCQPRVRRELFKNEEAARELAHFVERGGGLLTLHALVGIRDYLPPVPAVATGGEALAGSTWQVAGYHAITKDLDRRQTYVSTFGDRIGVVPGARGRTIARTPEGVPVVAAGLSSRGRYAACGLGIGIGPGDTDVPLSPAEAVLLEGMLRWLGNR